MQKEHLTAAAIFITLAVVMTWPLAPRMTHVVADPSDPFINTWILDWDHYATFHRPLTLFDANIFYPAHDTLAYSENLYGIALLLIPFRLLGCGPITAYNIAMLGGFAFSGFAAYLLGRRLTGSFVAGVAAGIFHAYVPFRFTHLPHVQHVFAGWLPLLVVALLDCIDRPSWRSGILFGARFLMNALSNIHWFLFGSFAIAAAALLFRVCGVRRWRELIVSTCVALLLFAPFLLPYARVAKTMSRSWAETKSYSAIASDWLVSSERNRVYTMLRDATLDPERRLFPGTLAIVCAALSIPLARRYPRAVTLGLLFVAIGFLGSLGLNFSFHQFLFDAVPGFRGVRVPARWAEIAYIGLSMLIAATTSFIARRQRWAAAVIPLLFVIELRAAPIRWYRVPVETPAVYRWLSTQSVRAVVELPIDIAGSDYIYAYRATAHHKNLVNGASGAVPEQYVRFSAMTKSSPIPDAFLNELRATGCDLVIVHTDWLPPKESIRQWLRRTRLPQVGVFESRGPGGDRVYSLGPARQQTEMRAWTFGDFHRPAPIHGKAFFSGYAVSPYGVQRVDLLFEDGNVRVPTTLIADAKLPASYGPHPRFVAQLDKRPDGVPIETDVQAEIVDGRGNRKLLQDYWIDWDH